MKKEARRGNSSESIQSESKIDFVKWFSELTNKDVAIAGGKGASLSEMYRNKFPIPPGFMVTAQAYEYFIDKAGLKDKIKEILAKIDIQDTSELDAACKQVRALIENASMPEELASEITDSYEVLDVDKQKIPGATREVLAILKNSHEPPFVAVRSSATTEDLADASFAGQQDTFLNIKGKDKLIESVKKCFASLFTARAVYYRTKKGFAHDKAYLAVVVQKMVNSEKSGVMFSKSPVNDDESIVIEAVWGLGEGIVSGRIKPDHYVIDKNLEEFKVKSIDLAEKKTAIVRNSAGENEVIKLIESRSKQQVLNGYEIKVLAQYARRLEEHYGKPQDIEFAIADNEIYIVQSRPITTKFTKSDKKDLGGEVLLAGLGASPGVASGIVKIIRDLSELEKVKKGDVLVTEMTNPDMVVSMQKAAAIVTDEGGVTSHAAIVSREMGIPAVVGTGEATKKLVDGQLITVDGNNGKVYDGKGETKLVEIKPIVPTKTKIKVLVDLPHFAERAALSGSKSVGLTRIEGIIAESGKHPLYFVKNERVQDYAEVIYTGLAKIAEYFDEMWIRASDIRSDEYRHLEGAPKEVEGNPMLGNHGIRFSLKNKKVMGAELNAVRALALKYPSKIFGIMVPQVIKLEEVIETKKIAGEIGMPENVKIGIMVETPAAVQVINSLCEAGISFISFGTNDLTQYTLAIDRNNEGVQYLYNEMDPAVLSALSYVIRRCKKYGVETSICGQAGSNEEMVRFLVSEGIDSISVNADAAEKISKLVAELEAAGIKQENGEDKEENSLKDKIVGGIKSLLVGEKKESDKKLEGKVQDAHFESPFNKDEKDIEEVVLEELGGNGELDDYVPGHVKNDKGIPILNDAIPLDEEHLREN
ncbi:MAG: phosphoenolpyruvate synthase [Nanoarchaeota archaeon]|nr:phosphoenolpyruvate synthase [Nanoarchaeota archaeon]